MRYIAILNMTSVLAQMDRDGVRARGLDQACRFNGIGIVGHARLAQRGHMIDIDTEK